MEFRPHLTYRSSGRGTHRRAAELFRWATEYPKLLEVIRGYIY